MTSEERREARYQRRVMKRAAKKAQGYSTYDDFDKVFSYGNLYRAFKKCRRSVAWKASVQKYITQAPLMVDRTYERLQAGSFRSDGFYEFDICERGKTRHIKSVTIAERVVQRCLCDNALVPVLSPTFIYDNGASLKNRGYHFSIRRIVRHLRKHYRKHGTEGYILLFDFSKFFENVSHELCKRIMRENFHDKRIIALTDHFIDMFGDVGLGLGSQISQTFALASANRLDHFVKEVLKIKGYGRYMDDGYLIHKSKEYLRFCLAEIRKLCKELGIKLNEKKTQIVKLSHGFTFLKTRFYITETGKVIRKIYKKSVTKERRKLKSFVPLMAFKVMTYADVAAAFQSWCAYAKNFNAWHTLQNMYQLYNELFIYPWQGGTSWIYQTSKRQHQVNLGIP